MPKMNVNNFLKMIKKKSVGKRLLMFTMGMFISAFALNLFYIRYDIIPMGSNGLALLVSEYTGIDESMTIFILSFICLLLGFIFFGKEYGMKMVAVTFLFPFFVSFTELITKNMNLDDTSLFLMMIFGGGMLGFSSGLIRKSQYSPGGFNVLFDLCNKYLHISVGTAAIIINMLLIIVSGFTYGIESSLYAIVSLLVSSYVTDKVIMGISDNKVFYIITSKPLEVRDYVMEKLHYSITMLKVRGGYTYKKRKMLMCVVPTIEYIKLKDIIREIDKDAFFLIVDIYETSIKKNCKNM